MEEMGLQARAGKGVAGLMRVSGLYSWRRVGEEKKSEWRRA
jgi:hypothetical protein